MVIDVVATETSIAWFHAGELKKKIKIHNSVTPVQSNGAKKQAKYNIIDFFPRKQMHRVTSRTNIDYLY